MLFLQNPREFPPIYASGSAGLEKELNRALHLEN